MKLSTTIIRLAFAISPITATPVASTDASMTNGTSSMITNGDFKEVLTSNSVAMALMAAQDTCTFQAFSGDYCDGGATYAYSVPNIPGGASKCFNTQNRHSYVISAGCVSGWVEICRDEGCYACDSFEHTQGSGQCINVDTGAIWQSAWYSAREESSSSS